MPVPVARAGEKIGKEDVPFARAAARLHLGDAPGKAPVFGRKRVRQHLHRFHRFDRQADLRLPRHRIARARLIQQRRARRRARPLDVEQAVRPANHPGNEWQRVLKSLAHQRRQLQHPLGDRRRGGARGRGFNASARTAADRHPLLDFHESHLEIGRNRRARLYIDCPRCSAKSRRPHRHGAPPRPHALKQVAPGFVGDRLAWQLFPAGQDDSRVRQENARPRGVARAHRAFHRAPTARLRPSRTACERSHSRQFRQYPKPFPRENSQQRTFPGRARRAEGIPAPAIRCPDSLDAYDKCPRRSHSPSDIRFRELTCI